MTAAHRQLPLLAVPAGLSWEPGDEAHSVERVCRHLATRGAGALSELGHEVLQDVWRDVWALFRDPLGALRQSLDARLVEASGQTPSTLAAGLNVMVEGASPRVFASLCAEAARISRGRGQDEAATVPMMVNLAAAPVGLALQCVLPALAVGRPLLLRSSAREPWFAPTLLAALGERCGPLRDCLAAVTWSSERHDIERAAVACCERVVAYGGAEATEALRARCGEKLWAFGPKLSAAVLLGRGSRDQETLRALATDVALFEQRGCLSLQLVLTDAPDEVGEGLARALRWVGQELEPPELSLADRARVREAVLETQLEGGGVYWAEDGQLGRGLVLVAPAEASLSVSPGCRVVRVYSARSGQGVLEALAPWRGLIQGVALQDDSPSGDHDSLRAGLHELGVSHLTYAGRLHDVDATWPNGGIDPLRLYGWSADRRLRARDP